MKNSKIKVLASFLNEEEENINISSYDKNVFEIGNQEYLVLTDEEADEKTEEYIIDSLWAFRASFVIDHMSTKNELSRRERDELEKSLQEIQGKLCESANSLIKAIIEDIDIFVEHAIQADGRGHFLSGYDGEENEEVSEEGEYFYIYRTN